MMQGDVTVVGLDTATTVLYDIGMDVPHRAVVTIPANTATVSKDLWRAISQRRLFQLHGGSVTSGPVRPVVPPVPSVDVWQEKVRVLEAENAALREQVLSLQRALEARPPMDSPAVGLPAPTDPRLDEILALLKAGVPVQSAGTVTRTAPKGVVEVEVPTFIPTEIKPKGVEGRLAEVQAETSENSQLGSAADALRRMRQGRQ